MSSEVWCEENYTCCEYEMMKSALAGFDYEFFNYDGSPYLCVHMDNILLSNSEETNFLNLKNLFVFFKLNVDFKILHFTMMRINFSLKETVNDFIFSHHSGNSNIIGKLREIFLCTVPTLQQIYLKSSQLCVGDSSSPVEELRAEYNENQTENNLIRYLLEVRNYFSYESLEGGPYKRWENCDETYSKLSLKYDFHVNNPSVLYNCTGYYPSPEGINYLLQNLKFNYGKKISIDRTDPALEQHITNALRLINSSISDTILVYKYHDGYTNKITTNRATLDHIINIEKQLKNVSIKMCGKIIQPSLDNLNELDMENNNTSSTVVVLQPTITNEYIVFLEKLINSKIIL